MYSIDHSRESVAKWIEFVLGKERLNYSGALCEGLIHNLNGPLQNVSMLVEMMQAGFGRLGELSNPDCEKELTERNQIYERQRQWAQKLFQQISLLDTMLRELRLLNEIECNPTEVDLNLLVSSLVPAFRCDLFFKHQVRFELRLASHLPLIRVLARHLIPAIVHLFENAMIALRGAHKKQLVIETTVDAERIGLSFRDTGCGLKPGEEEKCFDLFYSGWPPAAQQPERHFGVGLFLTSALLEPYGIKVRLWQDGDETVAALDIPINASITSKAKEISPPRKKACRGGANRFRGCSQ
jgi:signal transduction histidine kinase